MMSNMVLEAKNVTKSFLQGGENLSILKQASLSLAQNDFVALQGASGSGKSTLLHILGLLDSVDEGQLFLLGQDVTRLPESKRAALRLETIGFVFQFHHLIPELSAIENVCLPASMAKQNRQEDAEGLLHWMGLRDRMQSFPWQLSGGEQQRVALARALINRPKVLLTDEVTGNLDRPRALEVLELLKKVHNERETAVLSVTHDEELASRYSQRWHLEGGQIRKESP